MRPRTTVTHHRPLVIAMFAPVTRLAILTTTPFRRAAMSRCVRYVFVCVLVAAGLLVAVGELTAQQRAAVPGEQS